MPTGETGIHSIVVEQNEGLTVKGLYVKVMSFPVYLSASGSVYGVTVTEEVAALRHGSVKVNSNDLLSYFLGKDVVYFELDVAVIVTV